MHRHHTDVGKVVSDSWALLSPVTSKVCDSVELSGRGVLSVTDSVGWVNTVVFSEVVDTLSRLVDFFGCRHQRTYVPSGHRSSARNMFGSGHTHVRWNELCELDRRHSSTVTSRCNVDSKYCFSEDSLTSVSRRETNTFANRFAAFMLRSVARPMMTRLVVRVVVFVDVLAVSGLPLSSFDASLLRFWGHRLPFRVATGTMLSRCSRCLTFRFARSTRRSSRKADPRSRKIHLHHSCNHVIGGHRQHHGSHRGRLWCSAHLVRLCHKGSDSIT